MASLNLSTNGPSITKSYQSVISAAPPSGPPASSPTYGQWAIFTVQAPLVSAFQHDGSKESVLKVQSTGEGELQDFVEEFSDGRIQFGLVRVKDSNTALPKIVLVGWCGEGVPERTKGYFTSHLAAVAKLFQGYHVQITARSDHDIAPERIIQKVADASGSKYSGSTSQAAAAAMPRPPPVGGKPVFLPTRTGSSTTSGFNPLQSRSREPSKAGPVDEDGWGQDAPQLTRTQLEKVPSAYQPTKVGLPGLTSQSQDSSSYAPNNSSNSNDDKFETVRGAYQPIGKVDIDEIRRQARASGHARDDRPTPVKGAYEPVGKVDIAAIKARAQQPQATAPLKPADASEQAESKSLSERSAAFQQSERLSSLPKPKVANKFGGASSFTGTKAPLPAGFAPKTSTSAAPVGAASRTFADEGGKTPAQIWAEKKARQSGSFGGSGAAMSGSSPASTATNPISGQPSGDGGWKSGYTGKSWAPVTTTRTGQSAASATSDQKPEQEDAEHEAHHEPKESLSAIRQRFSAAPPPMDVSSKPNAGLHAATHVQVDEDDDEYGERVRPSSPIRVAMPVSRTQEREARAEEAEEDEAEEPEAQEPVPSLPVQSISQAASHARDDPPEPKVQVHDVARGAGLAAAETTFGAGAAAANPGASKAGKRALVQYDYEKAEDNEIELKEGEYVTNIDMVDEDWWMGQNVAGESGLFPANYVELVEEGEGDGEEEDIEPVPVRSSAPTLSTAPIEAPAVAAPATSAGNSSGKTATAQYDYEAAEDNEISFPDGATIINVEFPDDDWWLGEYNGKTGLFPANYVQLDE